MNPRTYKKMIKINDRLEEYGQLTRIVNLTPTGLLLNNGKTLIKNEANKFIKRVMNTKVIDWVKNTDKLLAGEISENVIKSISFSIGGRACQEKHANKIRNNMKGRTPWNKGKKGLQVGWTKGLTKDTDPRIAKMAEGKKGDKNPMYGKKYSDSAKEKKSKVMQQMILDGTFTPNSNNRNTHWDSYYKNKKYRSSWEALFQYYYPDALYENLRIEYTINQRSHIYIVDFIDHDSKIVAEVKPKELCKGDIFFAKMGHLKEWSKNNGYEVVIVDQDWFINKSEPNSYEDFDEKTQNRIKKLYETNKENRNKKI
jgi:hypothetical protein